MTPHEVKVWNWIRDGLHPLGWKFRRQVPVGPYVADFASLRPKIILEIDGDQHGTAEAEIRDAARDAFLRQQGFRVIRASNRDVEAGEQAFMNALVADLGGLDRDPETVDDQSP